ncbi:MAG TPA: c-type cytochrome [Micromonosporaceae bacterium]|nr:c-type cytochrome [Micromonosporaceae bacterium]
MTASPPDKPRARGTARRATQSRLRRRVGAAARMIAALALVGSVYAAFVPGGAAQGAPAPSSDVSAGKTLFDTSCITCHGANAQGVAGRGPSLIGVGDASVEFQVSTGRMPAAGQSAQEIEKQPVFDETQAQQIGAYIQSLGGGPQLPEGNNLSSGGNIAQGGDLFRVNCSSCHAFGGGGGALSSGKFAPTLANATDRTIYAAMLSGPQNMPVFGDNQISPQEKRDIIAYIQNLKSDPAPGGLSIGRVGPVAEGLVIFLVGIVVLLFAMLWIAGKS